MFSVAERVAFLREALADETTVVVAGFSTLLVEYARQWGATALVKGLRAVSDYEWEFQMGHLNKRLAPEIETVYLMSSPQYSFLSSSGVKEIAAFGGSLDGLVPAAVARALAERTDS
jgi:pantetheine-phosphate adenylyltransferase